MGGIGATELIIILFIILIVFGVGRLPELGSGIGAAIRNFKKASREPDEIDVTSESRDELPPGEPARDALPERERQRTRPKA